MSQSKLLIDSSKAPLIDHKTNLFEPQPLLQLNFFIFLNISLTDSQVFIICFPCLKPLSILAMLMEAEAYKISFNITLMVLASTALILLQKKCFD